MAHDSQGPIQVFDASVASLNLAFAQVLERLDQARGLRGTVTISDSTEVGAPVQQTDAIRLQDLPGESPASPLGWLLRPNSIGLDGGSVAPDRLDPLSWALAEAVRRPGDLLVDRGSFTITGTGFTATITGTALWVQLGPLVMLYIPTLSGTSNATTFTLTGLPTAQTPTQPASGFMRAANNGVIVDGLWNMATGGSPIIDLYPDAQGNVWNNAGSKIVYNFWLGYALL